MSDLIEDHLEYMRERGKSPDTIIQRRYALHAADKMLPGGLDDVSENEIRTYLGRPGFAQWTRRNRDMHLRGYYTWAVKMGHFPAHPMDGLDRPDPGSSVPHPFTDEEITQALAQLPAQPWRMAVLLGTYAGMRCAEIARSEAEHIRAGNIYIIGKGNKERAVPVHRLITEAAAGMSGRLVRLPNGSPATAHYLSRHGGRVLRANGVDGTLHDCRHWFGTATLEISGDIRVTQVALGHASVATTMIYTQVKNVRVQRAINALPDLT